MQALLAARAARRPAVLATRLGDGAQFLLPDAGAPLSVAAAAEAALAREAGGVVEIGGERWFLAVELPAPRLFVVGAVHIAQSLCPFAQECGFDVTVIDPRRGFATASRFPGTVLEIGWPDAVMNRLVPDAGTAVVVLSHDPKLDDPGLDRALRSAAFYIAALGSRRSAAARRERLAAMGHDAAALDRIRGPAGLAIGAVTAPEIAASILAELIAARRRR